jgi:putative DNA primase/helicase
MIIDNNVIFLKKCLEDLEFRKIFNANMDSDFLDSIEQRMFWHLLKRFEKEGNTFPQKGDFLLEVRKYKSLEKVREKVISDFEDIFAADLTYHSPEILLNQFKDKVSKNRLRKLLARMVHETREEGKVLSDSSVKDFSTLISRVNHFEGADENDNHKPFTTKLSEVEKRERKWLWKNYLPIGDATLISGDADTGKTWIALYIASIVSKGKAFPDGDMMEAPANVMYLSTEDEPDTTIKDRVQKLKGDESHFSVYWGEEKREMLDLASDPGLERLEREIKRIGGIKLLVVDPIIDFSPHTNPNKNEDVRKLLEPLIDLSRKLEFALIILSHLNKNQTENALYRAAGSAGGWLGKCRAAYLICNDRDNKNNHLCHKLKANHAWPPPKDFGFEIVDGKGIVIHLCDKPIDINHHLNTNDKKPREREDAIEWIYRQFEDIDEIPSDELTQRAIDSGISLKTFQRAKNAVGCKPKKEKFGDSFRWLTGKPSVIRRDKEDFLNSLDIN